ncbi:MAG: PilZ domain-containing protein [Calditerricola sp.]|nr:PilZ domain-containing protein [Calditerricola sp.]
MNAFRLFETLYVDVREEEPTDADHDQQEIMLYKTRIVDVTDASLVVEIPINRKTGQFRFFSVGTALYGWVLDETGTPCRFPTRVQAHKQDNIPLLVLERPDPQSILRVQRREYVRVQAVLDVSLRCGTTVQTVRTLDISGGGLKCAVHDLSPYPVGAVVEGVITLPRPQRTTVTFTGTVVRVQPPTEKGKPATISIRFDRISEKERQAIVQFCFRTQLKSRRR